MAWGAILAGVVAFLKTLFGGRQKDATDQLIEEREHAAAANRELAKDLAEPAGDWKSTVDDL